MWRAARRTLNTLALLAVLATGLAVAVVQLHGGKFLSVQTGSMTPHIDKGDLIIINRVTSQQLAVGDVITYISPLNSRKTLTHRIVAFTDNKITTKGDANSITDPPFSPTAVLGKVNYHVRYVGYILNFMRRPIGLLLLLYVPALSIVGAEVGKLSKAYRSQQPYFAPGVEARLRRTLKQPTNWRAVGASLGSALCLLSFGLARPVQAALSSPPVIWNGNTIATGILHKKHCPSSSQTTVVVQGSSSQTAQSGTASGESATSGSASNTSDISVQVNITSCS